MLCHLTLKVSLRQPHGLLDVQLQFEPLLPQLLEGQLVVCTAAL